MSYNLQAAAEKVMANLIRNVSEARAGRLVSTIKLSACWAWGTGRTKQVHITTARPLSIRLQGRSNFQFITKLG